MATLLLVIGGADASQKLKTGELQIVYGILPAALMDSVAPQIAGAETYGNFLTAQETAVTAN